MREYYAEYRGYKIKARPKGTEWVLAVRPLRPELPLMRRYSFRVSVPSSEDAITHAKRRVDLLLDLSPLLPHRT